jgi:hypothetical protein
MLWTFVLEQDRLPTCRVVTVVSVPVVGNDTRKQVNWETPQRGE